MMYVFMSLSLPFQFLRMYPDGEECIFFLSSGDPLYLHIQIMGVCDLASCGSPQSRESSPADHRSHRSSAGVCLAWPA